MVLISLVWGLFVLSLIYIYVLIKKEKTQNIIILTPNKRIFISVIISVFLFISILTTSRFIITGSVWRGDSPDEILNNTNKINNNQLDHISFVRNHFISTGNDVYGINIIGNNGQNGYIIMVDGYNRKMAVSYQCTVKTDGTKGIVITDPGCDYTHQY